MNFCSSFFLSLNFKAGHVVIRLLFSSLFRFRYLSAFFVFRPACVRAKNHQNLHIHSTLLELGASPNYRDARGLTPLYLSVIKKTDTKICESLLHDHATLGTQDTQGWQEVHQVKTIKITNFFISIFLR